MYCKPDNRKRLCVESADTSQLLICGAVTIPTQEAGEPRTSLHEDLSAFLSVQRRKNGGNIKRESTTPDSPLRFTVIGRSDDEVCVFKQPIKLCVGH